MKKICLTLVLFSSVALTACAVHTPRGSVVLDPDSRSHDNGYRHGKFCPPGQAKKGNC